MLQAIYFQHVSSFQLLICVNNWGAFISTSVVSCLYFQLFTEVPILESGKSGKNEK